MKIILYSDFKPDVSREVDDALLKILEGSGCRIAYIPSESDPKRRYFQKVQLNYEKIGISDVTYFDLGLEFDSLVIAELLKHDAIHLSGGDPVKFLDQIKMRQFGPILTRYVKSGGILIGVSAGAMILTGSLGLLEAIEGESVPKSCQRALGILDFEFYPHFKQDAVTSEKITRYAKSRKKIIYACDDDAGMLVTDGAITPLSIGNVTRFQPN